MSSGDIAYRIATAADLPGITHVRTSVLENHLSVAQMAERGITEAGVAASFLAESKGWVAEHGQQIVGFSIADRQSRSIFALFVLPGFDGRGTGSRLLELAVSWLWENGDSGIYLGTRQGTRAAKFYQLKGWSAGETDQLGHIRYELTQRSRRNIP